MEKYDQLGRLLTCAICLDRYRNPKLLPCQHSFCAEPCLEGTIDYVRKQIKCPECRAEHRVGYQGVAGFPTNVTLTRFLELHIDLTGEMPDPYSNQMMERCQICSEKAYCNACAHCEKKICSDCKDAHIDVLKREIQRITNQTKRVINRLEDAVATIDKNMMQLQSNSISVIEEIDDIYRRSAKALKDRAEYLKHEVERYLGNEIKQLSTFRSNLEQEVGNIQSNTELVEKYMVNDNGVPMTWQDNELMDTKDIFLKTMEFIRNFEYEPGDCARKIKFSMNQDPNSLTMNLGTFGDVHLPTASKPDTLGVANNGNQSGLGGSQLSPGQGSALMRSKSDHRLTTQFRQQQDDDDSCCGNYGSGRKFGEPRQIRTYGQDDESSGGDRKSRFRSRFTRHLESSFEEPEPQSGSRVRFEAPPKERERVLDTDDVCKGPMSGIGRLSDSPRVIQRIADSERPKKPSPAPIQVPQAPIVVQKVTTTANPQTPWRGTSRQMSEDDEIAKQKKQNKEADRQFSKQKTSNEPKSPSYTEPEHPSSEVPSHAAQQQQDSRVRKLSPDRFPKKRSESEDSGSTSESATSGSVGTGAIFSLEDVRQRFMNKTDVPTTGTGGPATASQRKDSTSSVASSTNGGGSKGKYPARYVSTKPEKKVEAAKEEDEEEESSESETSESESEEEESDSSPPVPVITPTKKNIPEAAKTKMEKTDIGALLARSANARDRDVPSAAVSSSSSPSSYTPRSRRVTEEPPTPPPSSASSYRRNRVTSPPVRETERYGTTTTSNSTAGMGSSRYPSSYTSANSDYSAAGLSRSRTGTSLYSAPAADDSSSSRYSSGLASKYLNRSRHNFDTDDHPTPSSSSRYGSSTPSSSASTAPLTRRSYLSKNTNESENETPKSSRLTSLRDRRAKVNRSKSSHDVLAGIDFNKDDEEDGPESPGRTPYANYQRRKSTVGPVDGEYKTPNTDESTSLSSWARYLKNKYGKDRQQPAQAQRSPVEELPKFNFSTNPYMNKKRLNFKFGSRGSDPGFFTWPRGIACGPDGQIVVADSSNHRLQVFQSDGTFVKEFGGYGNGEGEMDCLAGVAVNRIGQFIVSDRYNHRIQVFDPSGRFLRSFGSQGTSDGKFNYPWGVATDALGFIYVCDKENHRIQVFQSDGTFVGKFGSMGSKHGELEHPHYIAVTSTNKVIVTDTNNHRISIWDVNGRVLSSIGTEGSEDGQFKLPRGLAVDEAGVIIVGDSGNNRIVILSPEGKFLRSFGCWGSGDGEFKGLEGVAVNPNGNILVCDRENHRIQIF